MQRRGERGVAGRRRRAPGQGNERDVVDMEVARSIEVRGHCVGRIVRWLDEKPIVDFPGNPHKRLIARSTVPLAELRRGARRSARLPSEPEVLLVFEGERSNRPIIVGVMVDEAAPALMASTSTSTNTTAPAHKRGRLAREALTRHLESDDEELIVSARRVVLNGTEELVLRSGKASVTLRRNGRVVERGTYLESDSKGINRIKGASVKLN